VENINITEQLNKFKKLINAKSGEVILEQTDGDVLRATANKIVGDIRRATSGAGTNNDVLLAAIKQINSLPLYNAVNGVLKQNPIVDDKHIIDVLNDELGYGDLKVANEIKQALEKIGKFISFTPKGPNNPNDVVAGTFKIVDTKAPKTTQNDVVQQKNDSNIKQGGGSNTRQQKNADWAGLNQRFTKSIESLGIQNGKMDVATLQKILQSLEGSTSNVKNASDYSPQGVPADALNPQLAPDTNL
jgi:hypothetical protein